MPYQEPPRSRWNPYGQYELPMLHQGQGSHTHFNDEEEEEEEPQARSSEPQEATPVAWSAPDGRLPSPDHDLVSQSFGAFWSIWDKGAWRDLAHGSSSTGYAKEEGRSHLEDQLDRPLDQPVEFLNSTGQASTRSS
ncbi:unnamed protein product [Microthlaspi erraticum]|uniref:Uncharacterized protein n=1 Tax=Microthlaspi erraticum TaxID=1685480 RepID=A0A6D2J4V0_9BRAS|nr:unnamed protein product [Microthlaspi erraticum]